MLRNMAMSFAVLAMAAGCGGSGVAGSDEVDPQAVLPRDERPAVAFAGDSMMASLTPALRAALGPAGAEARFTLYPELPRREADQRAAALELAGLGREVIFMIGVWEGSILATGENELVDIDEANWREHYRRLVVVPFLEAVAAAGTSVVWVGMTPVADPLQSLGFAELSAVFRQAVDEVPGHRFVDAGALLAGPDGRFRATIEDEDGENRPLTAGDGLHLCPAGAALIADAVVGVVGDDLRRRADPTWRETAWTAEDRVMDRSWYESERCG